MPSNHTPTASPDARTGTPATVLSLPAARRAPVLRGAAVVGSAQEVSDWLGLASATPAACIALATRLRQAGAAVACLLGTATLDGRPLDWLDGEHARGWLAATGEAAADGDAFSRALADALQRGFVPADAAIVAKMASQPGSLSSPDGFIADPRRLPQLSWGEALSFSGAPARAARPLGVYAIVDNAQRLQQALDAGVRTVQLRIKAPPSPDHAWELMLRAEVQRSMAACLAADAELFINDHWRAAAACGAPGVHLGQEDLVALGEEGRAALAATGLALGVSSHSLWELCRARALAPRYIACGPVWPTKTKDLPWVPQGLDNLAWWCRMAGAPVVAIGGVLGAEQVREAARCGADGVCIVRGLGEQPRQVVPLLQAALAAGRDEFALRGTRPAWPHPSLAVPG